MDNKEYQTIEEISKRLILLLKGEKTEPISLAGCPECLGELSQLVNNCVDSFSEIWRFILPLSKGILNIEAPMSRNPVAYPFKELHSQLRNLIWQVQQISHGDYKQRVDFMGDFSIAFNSLIEALEQKSHLVNQQITHLEDDAIRFKESEERYSSAVQHSPGGIYIFDPITKKVLESNEQFQAIMGYSGEDISKLTVYDFYLERATADGDLNDIINKSLHNISTRQYRRKNGNFVDLDIYTCWSNSEKRNVVIVNIQDVTERNKALETSKKYKILLEQAHDIILFVRSNGKIIEANRAAEVAYGYTRDELLSLDIYKLRVDPKEIVDRHIFEAHAKGITFETVHRRKDGSDFPVEVSAQGIMIGNENVLVSVTRDIRDRKRIEVELQYLATHDVLTGVHNRYVLEKAITQTIAKNKQNRGALLLVDVDNFKFVNDTFGHTVGDKLLVDLATTLKRNLRSEDILSRMGGDEFAILLNNVTLEEARFVAEKLRGETQKIKIFPDIYDISFSFSISIGVAPLHNRGLEYQKIISYADNALYSAKEKGRNRVAIATELDTQDKFTETNSLMRIISEALEKDWFVLFFQPIVNINSGKTIHHEGLMRLVTDHEEIIYPGKIIPIAERFGLMNQIDRKIVNLSFEALETYPDLRLFINLSGSSLGDESFLDVIVENIRSRGLEPSRLGFEITETVAVKDLVSAGEWIRRLKEIGCRFALDDFGIGFSTFAYLQYLPVDYVKIDGSYVRDIDKNDQHRALVQAMNTVAISLGKETIAEFVENSSVLNILKEYQVSHVQGYHLGKPEPHPIFTSIDE